MPQSWETEAPGKQKLHPSLDTAVMEKRPADPQRPPRLRGSLANFPEGTRRQEQAAPRGEGSSGPQNKALFVPGR